MQLKSLFVLISVTAFAFATSTVQDVLYDVSIIENKVAGLHTGLDSFPQTGGTVTEAIDVHNNVGDIIDCINDAISTSKDVVLPISPDDGNSILDALHNIVPVVKSCVQDVVDKKDIFGAVAIGRAHAIIHLDLIHLKQSVLSLEAALLAIAPKECEDEGRSLALDVKDALDLAINAYAQ